MDKSKEVLQDKMINDLALNYAVCLVKYGVDIREKWKTAIQNKFALEQAYLRGREDERKRIEDLEEQGRLIIYPCKEGDELFIVGTKCLADEEPEDFVCDLVDCDDCLYDKELIVFKRIANIFLMNLLVSKNNEHFIVGETVFFTREEAEAKLRELLK